MMVIQLKGKKKSCEKNNKYLKKMYTNVKDEAHGNNRQLKNVTKKTQCVFVGFWNENKSTMPITNKDEKERREKTRRFRKKKKREIEHHKTLNHPLKP